MSWYLDWRIEEAFYSKISEKNPEMLIFAKKWHELIYFGINNVVRFFFDKHKLHWFGNIREQFHANWSFFPTCTFIYKNSFNTSFILVGSVEMKSISEPQVIFNASNNFCQRISSSLFDILSYSLSMHGYQKDVLFFAGCVEIFGFLVTSCLEVITVSPDKCILVITLYNHVSYHPNPQL